MGLRSEDDRKNQKKKHEPEDIILNEVQLLLAEKRTSLASLRTGIGVFALPISVLSFLIVTSKYYDVTHIIRLLLPLMIINAALVILGIYLIIRSIVSIHHHDRHIKELKLRYSLIADIVD